MKDRPSVRHSESSQLVRQWAILRLLRDSAKACTVKQLAEQLRVSKATIKRDLATLEREFAVVEQRVGKQKRAFTIDREIQALESLRFGTMELLAIYASHAMLGALAGTALYDDLGAVVTKIRGALSPRHNGGLDALCRVFQPHVRAQVDYEPQREQIDQLVDPIARRRICTLTYHAAWKGTTRQHTARPLRLLSHKSALYLLACLGEHDRITTLAVHRIRMLDVTSDMFTRPRLNVDAFISKAFGIFVSDHEEDVEIRFDSEIAWHVEERTFHPSELKERCADGSLRYRIRSSAQWEIVPWVQSFGGLAELLSPASWRTSIRASAEAVLARYSSI